LAVDNTDNLTLTVSPLGDNVLTVGNGNSVRLSADGSHGNNTLTAGDGAGDVLSASLSSGSNTLKAGNGIGDQLIANFSSGNNALTAGNGDGDVLSVQFTTGSNTLIAGSGNNDVLDARNSIGNNILIAGNGNGDSLFAGAGNDTLQGGSGDDTLIAGFGNDMLEGNGGNNVYNFANASSVGTYTINNFHTDAGRSVIQLGAGITASQIVATRTGNDLVLTAASDPITVQNYFLGSNFQLSAIQFADGSAISIAEISPLCFLAGTRVRTPLGEMQVEKLKRGDLILTAQGRAVPVRWIGRQTVSTIFADSLRVMPIRIKTGALGCHVPSRDLLLSPDHAVLVGDMLIQAGALVNGVSVVREANASPAFTYYHVELDDHSLILAENTPAETFVDNVERLAFDNWDEYEALYPGGRSIVEMPYPRAKAHRQVPQAVRTMLAARAALICDTAGHIAA
jgi:hypothetical protein